MASTEVSRGPGNIFATSYIVSRRIIRQIRNAFPILREVTVQFQVRNLSLLLPLLLTPALSVTCIGVTSAAEIYKPSASSLFEKRKSVSFLIYTQFREHSPQTPLTGNTITLTLPRHTTQQIPLRRLFIIFTMSSSSREAPHSSASCDVSHSNMASQLIMTSIPGRYIHPSKLGQMLQARFGNNYSVEVSN